jgi:hypothetical protein
MFTGIGNQELVNLLSQVPELESDEQEALRLVLDAMLTKRRIQHMVGPRKSA